MSLTKIGPKHRITIPEDAVEALHLGVGDVLEGRIESGKLVLVPRKRKKKGLEQNAAEQKVMASARRKIKRIRKDLATARGLTPEEAAAARAGLIDHDQQWWWTENWQGGERRAERDLRAGRTKSFDSVSDLIEDLRARCSSSARSSSLGTSSRRKATPALHRKTRATPHCEPSTP